MATPFGKSCEPMLAVILTLLLMAATAVGEVGAGRYYSIAPSGTTRRSAYDSNRAGLPRGNKAPIKTAPSKIISKGTVTVPYGKRVPPNPPAIPYGQRAAAGPPPIPVPPAGSVAERRSAPESRSTGAFRSEDSHAPPAASYGSHPFTRPVDDSCTVFPTGTSRSIRENRAVLDAQLSRGNGVLITPDYLAVNNYDLLTRKIRSGVSLSGWPYDAQFSPSGRQFATIDTSGTLKLVESSTGRVFNGPQGREYEGTRYNEKILAMQYSPDGRSLLLGFESGSLILLNLHTRKPEAQESLGSPVTAVAYSQDGKSIAVATANGEVHMLDPITLNPMATVKVPYKPLTVALSPDGKTLAVGGTRTDATPTIQAKPPHVDFYDLKKGEKLPYTIEHSGNVNRIQFSPDGALFITASDDGTAKLYSFVQKRIIRDFDYEGRVTSAGFSPDGADIITATNKGTVLVTPLSDTCVDDKKYTVTPKAQGEDDLSLIPIEASQLCEEPYSRRGWEDLTPYPTGRQISRKDALMWMLRFEKPGGFDAEQDIPMLMALIDSDLPETEPHHMTAVMQNLLLSSNRLYEAVLRRLGSRIYRMSRHALISRADCRTEAEEARIQKAATGYPFYLMGSQGAESSDVTYWQKLVLLQDYLKKIPASVKEKGRLFDLSEQSGTRAQRSPFLKDVDGSTLRYLIDRALSPLFGGHGQPMTDLTYVRDGDTVHSYLLGTQPINGNMESLTKFGIYADQLPDISLPTVTEPTKVKLPPGYPTSWMHGKSKYTLSMDIEALPKKDVVLREDKPPYGLFYGDQKKSLLGMVIVGTNRGNDRPVLLQHYKDIYTKAGRSPLQGDPFVFGKPVSIPNLKDFLERNVELKNGDGTALDYLFLEAHHDADNKNLIRLDRSAKYEYGSRKLADGRTQGVFLIYPDRNDPGSNLISNEEFGDWIRKREANGLNPLALIMKTCDADIKFRNLLNEVYSPNLLLYPGKSESSYPATPDPDNAGAQYLNQLLSDGSYGQMRQAAKNDPLVRMEQSELAFPDEPDYEQVIQKSLEHPARINLKIWGPDGRPYVLEAHHPE